jgi:hypothetical protein
MKAKHAARGKSLGKQGNLGTSVFQILLRIARELRQYFRLEDLQHTLEIGFERHFLKADRHIGSQAS